MTTDSKKNKLPKGITQRSDGRYMARFTLNGKRETLYGSDVKELQEKVNDKKYEIKNSIIGYKNKVITLDTYFNIWLNDYKKGNVKETTYNHFLLYYELYIKRKLGKRKLSEFTPVYIQRFYNDMANEGFAKNTIKKCDIILHNLFEIAIADELVSKNPCKKGKGKGITIPDKNPTPDKRMLTEQEQDTFLDFVRKSDKWKRHYSFFVVGFNTGMRLGEILALKWDDVDYTNSEIRVDETLCYLHDQVSRKCKFVLQNPKTKSSARIIPMIPEAHKALKKQDIEQKQMRLAQGEKWRPLEGINDLVFTTSYGTPIDPSSLGRLINSIIKDMNQQGILFQKIHLP